MPSDLSTLDLATSNAVMVQHWAFAAELLASKASSAFSALFSQALTARLSDLTSTTHRSTADQLMDVFALEVASAQEEPALVAA